MRRVKIIAVTNQKGGVGKTTTVANLGAALAARGHDVCLIDLDAQSQLTLHFGVEVAPDGKTVYDILTRGADLLSAAVNVREHLSVVPAEPDLAAAEMELVGTVGREQVLADCLGKDELPYEFVLIDCPPSLGLLTLNALAAADELLIPLQAHFFGLQGISGLFETVSLVRQRINPRLRVGGVLFCMFDRRTRLAEEVVSDLTQYIESARGTDAPWAQAKVFKNAIRRNVKLAECPSYGKTIFDYEPKSHGAEDYSALADEFLACFAEPVVPEPVVVHSATGESPRVPSRGVPVCEDPSSLPVVLGDTSQESPPSCPKEPLGVEPEGFVAPAPTPEPVQPAEPDVPEPVVVHSATGESPRVPSRGVPVCEDPSSLPVVLGDTSQESPPSCPKEPLGVEPEGFVAPAPTPAPPVRSPWPADSPRP